MLQAEITNDGEREAFNLIRSISGAAHRPIRHTCGYTLELPSTYANFCELREEFSDILSADSFKLI